MRKILLLLLVGFVAVAAKADVVAFIAQGATNYSGDATTKVTVSGTIVGTPNPTFTASDVCTLEWTKVNSSSSNVTGALIRWYANDKLTITPATGVTITKVSLKCSSNSYASVNVTASTGTYTASKATATPCTWEGTGDAAFTLTPAAQIRVSWIEIEYTAGTGNALSTPEITVGAENMVTITSKENAPIFYTLDGNDPSASSTAYSAPFAIDTKCQIKAIAIQGDDKSSVATKLAFLTQVSNLADFITNGSGESTKVAAPVTAIYQNGRNLYIKDANDNFILAYNDKDLASVAGQFTNNGDEISFISGTFKLQAQLPELLVTEVGEKSAGTAVDPYEVNISDIDATMLNQYVTFGPVNIVEAANGNANNYDVTDADGGSILMYNPFTNATYYDVVEVPTGEGFTVTGFVSTYNSTLQITPVMIEGGVVMEKVEAPVFSPEAGELSEGDLITITSATEGASIYYTTEDVTPTVDNAFLYSEPIPFTEAVTIKAIAIKDGMIDSDVTTASYTLKVAGATTATFDFHNTEATLAQATDKTLTVPEDGKGTNVKDHTFVSNAITLTVSQGTNTSNPPMWWNYTPTATAPNERGCELRLYVNEYVTVSAASGYKINKIAITQNAGSTTFGTQTVTCEGGEGTWTAGTKTWTATSGDVTSVKFVAGATSRYGQFTVEYVATSLGAIDSVISDADADAPAEYFNLQGIRVNADNLTPGIYVLRQGNKVSKVLVK